MKRLLSVAIGALVLTQPLASPAQDLMPGEHDFQAHCAICHGAGGRGDGMVGELFKTAPKDLTQLSRENGGAFPFQRVIQAIDGSTRVVAHGIGDPMPIWGDFLNSELHGEIGLAPADAKAIAQARIVALTYYIQTLQQ
ncbi:MAG: c-type cytochrome [Paracoccaceae bacterium]|nr:c-type cytochrome [Paracoccaceae bacterium]